MMNFVAKFTLRDRRLHRDGVMSGAVVDGEVIEAQHELADGAALVWLTDDSPYDEGLHIYLVSAEGKIQDAVEAGSTFSPGILGIRESGGDWVEFDFFRNDQVYRLEVAAKPRFHLLLPPGWKYKTILARHRLSVTVARGGEG